MVVNPIFECRDHMDNLRHLGAQGFLTILLQVVCAGILFIKLLSRLSLDVACSLLRTPLSVAVGRPAFGSAVFATILGPPLPLRI